uniref:A disintegrin and metalloproteinase with thrombospondin motifs 16 n=1 Tax=Bactrocera dorsalis TaxID=27457 RepID=A0A034V501_BACDO
MSHNIRILLAIIASIVTICSSLPDYHKQMSPTQLQSVFHVDDVNAVPHYEVVQLLHNSFDDGLASLPEHYRRRRRRSINSVDGDARPTIKEPHHVKKDLSKNPYYSELKAAANTPGAGGVNSLQQAANGKFAGDLRELKEHKVSFNAFGENLNLTLKRTDSLFKGGSPHTLRMWTVRDEANATHGLDMQEVFDEDAQSSDQIGEVYQDEANMAAILMRRHLETGDLVMEGSIGHEMVIKPLPHELSPNPDAAHHIVYKREAQPLEHLSDFAFMEPDDLATSEKLERLQQHRQRRAAPAEDDDEAALEEVDGELESAEARFTRNRRQLPYIIYPEVLVIIDYDGYRLHGGDNLQVKRYFVSFWNGVDLRYRLLKGPRIRISIAGIIISRGRDATPYLERNRVGRDAIDSAAALTDMGKYLFRERRLPVYDIAVAITKYDMCRRRKGGRCTKGTAGFAYVGGACVVNKRLEKVNSVAIIEDTGGFSGIIVAAHEVGHLLGAVHDGSPPPSYLGGPGAQRCRWEDGYIMSDLRHTERGFRWSPCTIQSFHHFLNGDTATCLHNAPHEDSALGRALPGTLLSLDAQCRRDRGTYACFKDERVCAQLFCFDAQTGYCVAYRPAAEGSTCGSGLTCLDGRCTPVTSNVIPAYRSYNNTVSAAAKLQQQSALLDNNNRNNADDIDDNEDNVNDSNVDADDDASNEAIDDKQQKRKFNTATTISVSAQQQQNTQPAPPPSAPTRSSSNGGSITNSNGNNNNNNKALQRPATFLDAYLKKLQALNAPTDTTATLTATTTSTTMSTSSVVGNGAVGKAVPAAGTPENEPVKRAPAETFGSHFLKRTQNLSNSKSSNVGSSSGVDGSVGNSSDSNIYINHGHSNNNTNNSNRNHKKLTRISSHNAAANSRMSYDDAHEQVHEHVVSDVATHIATTTQQPAYVTNYLGDNTNNLPSLLEQQQQAQQSSSTKTTTTSAQEQQNQQTSQQKAHKIRTQKLIRRQLLRTQIK